MKLTNEKQANYLIKSLHGVMFKIMLAKTKNSFVCYFIVMFRIIGVMLYGESQVWGTLFQYSILYHLGGIKKGCRVPVLRNLLICKWVICMGHASTRCD